MVGIPGGGWVRDQFLNALSDGLGAIQEQVFAIIAEVLGVMESLILQVPVPKNEAGETIIFSVPDSGIFATLWDIYQGAQPIGYFLLFLAVVIILGFETFENVIPDSLSKRSVGNQDKKVIAIGFILVTFWWYIGVIIFGIASLITNLFLEAGGGAEEGGLTAGFDMLETFVENAEGPTGAEKQATKLGASAVLIYLYGTNLTILLPLLALWVFRLILLYLMLPLGPVLIGLWGFRVPGFKPLKDIGTKSLKWFSLLAFMSVPGAVLIGFSGVMINSVLSLLTEDSGITGDSGFGESSDAIIINSGPDTAGSLGISKSEVLASEIAGGGPVPETGAPEFYLGVVIGTSLAVAIPFIAAAGPFILIALGNMDAKDVATMATNPAAGVSSVMAKGLDGNGKPSEYASDVLDKTNSALTGNDSYVDEDGFNTSTGSVDKEKAAEEYGVDSYDELSRSQRAKARTQQTGMLGTGSWATDEAATKAKENYQEAYVEGRALATNKDYRSGVISEATNDVANTVSTKASDIRPEPVESVRESKEEMERRLNNISATHQQLKEEASARDYKDGAERVDGDLLLTEDEEDMMDLFREHGHNPELESESISEQEVESMRIAEESKYKELEQKIQEQKESATGKVSEQELEKLQGLRQNVQMLNQMEPGGESPFDEDAESSARRNALAIAEKAEESRKAEEHGMLNHEKAIENDLLSIERQAQRGELTPDELREQVEVLEEKKEYADKLVENPRGGIFDRDAEKRQRELERKLETVESELNAVERGEDIKEDAEQAQSMANEIQEMETSITKATQRMEDTFEDIATSSSNSVQRGASVDEFVNEDGSIDEERLKKQKGVDATKVDQLSSNQSEIQENKRDIEDVSSSMEDMYSNISVGLDDETQQELLNQNEEYKEIQNELNETVSELKSEIRERKDIAEDQEITIEDHRDVLSDDEITKLEERKEAKVNLNEQKIISEEMSEEHIDEVIDRMESEIERSFVEFEEGMQGDEFDAIKNQVESAERRLEENRNLLESATEKRAEIENEAITIVEQSGEEMVKSDTSSEKLKEKQEQLSELSEIERENPEDHLQQLNQMQDAPEPSIEQ